MKMLLLIIFVLVMKQAMAQPEVQRIQGTGNGGLVLDMTQASEDSALLSSNHYRVDNPIYESGGGPITVDIYDSTKACGHTFTVYLSDTSGYYALDTFPNSKWYIKEMTSGDVDSSDKTIIVGGNSEKMFAQWGLEVQLQQTRMPGQYGSINNGFLQGSMVFTDSTKQWLTGIPTDSAMPAQNWLYPPSANDTLLDSNFVYMNIMGGTWGPFRYGSSANNSSTGQDNGPLFSSFNSNLATPLTSLASVDIFITSDTSMWSRSVVIEEDADTNKAQGGAIKGQPRRHASVDKNGLSAGDSGYYAPDGDFISPNGMGWFPGYAIDLETGERLNIMFGEDSYLVGDSGSDMKFNPSSNIISQYGDPELGGKHYIYVMGRGTTITPGTDTVAYDNCALLKHNFDSLSSINNVFSQRNFENATWKDCMWVNLPLTAKGHSILETDVRIRLRVAKSYRYYDVGGAYSPIDTANKGIPYYSFNITCDVGIDEYSDAAKNILDAIYPDPFSNDLYIKVNMPAMQHVTIMIYDLLGQEVAAVADQNLTYGEHTFYWDGNNKAGDALSNGLYLVRIQTEKESVAKSVMLLRN